MSFSASDRSAIRERLARPLDCLIVGGGINGAALARDLVGRGARVGLVEKDDFASGTSSKSSRLIHGGLRYLEEALQRPLHAPQQIALVFESVTERWRLASLARHLVRPQPFVMPTYRHGRIPLWAVAAGVALYDALALYRAPERGRKLGRDRTREVLPKLNPVSLTGGMHYYDYRTDDARLTLENAIDAHRGGAAILTRASAIEPLFEAGVEGVRQLRGALVRDDLTGESFPVRARVVVSTTGPWTDLVLRQLGSWSARPKVRPTKGVHVVVPAEKLPLSVAAAVTHPRDGRVLFALPFHERSVLGTTDTDFKGTPDDVRVDATDVDYLLEMAAHYFPDSRLSRADVISSWAGLRPLVNEEDVSRASGVSREERIVTMPEGIVLLFGGKLTTHRRIAEELADVVARRLASVHGVRLGPSRTKGRPFPGAEGLDDERDLEALENALRGRAGLTRASATHLAETYGMRAVEMLERAARDAGEDGARRMIDDLPHVWEEIGWAADEEMAMSLDDVLVRRTGIFYRALDQGLGVAEKVAARLAASLGWSDAHRDEQLARYRAHVAASRAWRDGGQSAAAAPGAIGSMPERAGIPAPT